MRYDQVHLRYQSQQVIWEYSILKDAQKEIASTGTLLPATYKEVLDAVEQVRTEFLKPRWLRTKDDSSPSEVKLDDQFVASLEEAKNKLENMLWSMRNEKRRDDVRYGTCSTWGRRNGSDPAIRQSIAEKV